MSRAVRFLFSILLVLTLIPLAAMPAAADVEAQAPLGSWLAQYWNGIDLSGPPLLQRVETSISNNWGAGSPGAPIAADFFSARWTGTFTVTGGSYRLRTLTDDGVRVRVDGALVIDDWILHSATERTYDMTLSAGVHTFVIEYFEQQGDAVAYFDFTPSGATGPVTVSISPTSGPAGTILQVHAWGFWQYANVTLTVHQVGHSAISSHVQAADTNGHLWATETVPSWAGAGSQWQVDAVADALSGSSTAFTVGGGGGYPSPCGPTYVVRAGDWFYQIARTCAVSVTDLRNANPQIVNTSLLYPGQVLYIPSGGSTPPPTPSVVTAVPSYNLNFRTGPSTGYGIIGTVPRGVSVTVAARGPNNWLYVRYGSRYGWIAGWYCTISGNLSGLPYRAS